MSDEGYLSEEDEDANDRAIQARYAYLEQLSPEEHQRRRAERLARLEENSKAAYPQG